MSCTDRFDINATIVANEFIEKYMPEASGDYVKVYLYLLKNRTEGVEISRIAEALRMTEGDVRRAIKYWEEKGIVSVGRKESSVHEPENADSALGQSAFGQESADAKMCEETVPAYRLQSNSADNTGFMKADKELAIDDDELKERYKNTAGKAILNTLSEDEEFVQLLFIVQKYRAKILTEREQEILAYLYHGLSIPCDVIDYLVAYCVENSHNNMRYIEKVGLDWAKAGIKDVKAAKRRTSEIDKMRRDTAKKSSTRTARAGITRSNDIDDWVKTRVLEKL